jgi:hypothetical protein
MLSDVQARQGVRLVPRTPASSIEELIAGATDRQPLGGSDGKSGSTLERVVIDGEPFVLKQLHPDRDWTMRGFGDLWCRPVQLWVCGLLDAMPEVIDHAVVGAATGLGRHGWGGALLLRDVSEHLIPEGDEIVPLEDHRQLLDHLAEMSARFWGAEGVPDMITVASRYSAFGPGWLEAEQQLGWPDPIPVISADGWRQFSERAPADVRRVVDDLRHDNDPLARAIERTPLTFLHGDWKMGNLGVAPGRTILLDWTYPGIGPLGHELAWYLAVNRLRLPESKEDTIDALRRSLEARGIATDGWWQEQVDLCLLGCMVQFGWEKALGDDDELGWWCDRAREGARWL